MARFTGFSIGPFVFGRTIEDQPQTRADRWTRLVSWLIVVALITSASLPVGLLLMIPTALYLIALVAAPPDDTEDQS